MENDKKTEEVSTARLSLTKTCALLVVTALELDPLPLPLGVAYATLMNNLSLTEFQAVTSVLRDIGWATVTSETLTLTDAGRAKAKIIAQVLEEGKKT